MAPVDAAGGPAARGKEHMNEKQSTMAERIRALREMKVAQLVVAYERAFNEPPRSKNKNFLWRRVAWKWQADLEGGGLPERVKARLAEIACDVEEAITKRRRAVAGPAAPAKTETAVGRSEVVPLARVRREGLPLPGTRLTRTYHDREISVTIHESGVECGGVMYRSLSAAANAITGSHVSGMAFFGLRPRKSSAKGRAKK